VRVAVVALDQPNPRQAAAVLLELIGQTTCSAASGLPLHQLRQTPCVRLASPSQKMSALCGTLLDMTEISLLRPAGLVHSPAFSQVAVVPPGATTIYVGGQNAVDADGKLVGGNDIAAQTRQVMTNLVTALAAAGATVHDLVAVTLLIAERADLARAYPVAAEALDGAVPTVLGARVATLAVPGALIEVSAVAAVFRQPISSSATHCATPTG
jgi:enamine deaminase RidA (YjgF/YER057c/UK114 family)